jgi:hypothetical protein
MMLMEELAEAERRLEENRPLPASIRKQIDPRARLLMDLRTLIEKERSKGGCK